jgi:hypothetical protein
MRHLLIVALLCTLGLGTGAPTAPAFAAPPVFDLPIGCSLPDRCFIEFYVDHGAGSLLNDYRCGNRTYDTHRGTDFRVRSPADFAAGIPVLAAAAGTVIALRDEMPDIDVLELGRDKVAGRANGNTVVLQHDDGWTTQYLHMRRGSVTVRQGDRVSAGQKLGLVGLSGDTNFPHLHFEVRDRSKTIVDPFSSGLQSDDCRQAGEPMWSKSALAAMAYRAVDGIGGFTGNLPSRNDAIYGRANPPRVGGALFFWFEMFGVERGDVIGVQYVLANGSKRPAQEIKVELGTVSYIFRATGLNREVALEAGIYTAILTLKRGGVDLFERRFEIEVKG